MIQFININDLIVFHEKVMLKTGGLDGIRDYKLLDSALNRGLVTYNGQELYDSLEKKIAVTSHSLITNHGFIDGNKRIGVVALILLCRINGIDIDYAQEELTDIGLYTAEGKYDEEYIYNWIITHETSNIKVKE